MNQHARILSLALLAATAVLAGCATSRSEIDLPAAPQAVATKTPTTTAYIRTVRDARVFEEAPGEPSTPSLGFGGSAQATADIKARAVGRKRNTFGKALGDILLKDGQTAESVIRDQLGAALSEAGYRVAPDAAQAGPDAVPVDASITKFWTWFTPGFWAITVSADIATDITIGDGAAKSVVAYAEDKKQVAADGTWIDILSLALDDYRKKAAEAFRR